ncbi:MAG TPA: spore coat protein [Firmicutes bacterium]|nr:spore coat protein [Bacillota bacterium]
MMEDKVIMNTCLTLTKNTCDILMHGAIEASTPNIKSLFETQLTKYLEVQGEIFKEMEKSGMYKMENVPESKIKKTCEKHQPTC